MSEAGFTEGPWELGVTTSVGSWRPSEQSVQIWKGEQLIASYVTGYCEYPDDATCAANARLMTAAPDLLEAVRLCLLCISGEHDTDSAHQHAMTVALTAIAKATGAAA